MGFKSATRTIDILAVMRFKKTVEVPAIWTGDQINDYVDKIDEDTFYDMSPSDFEVDWEIH